MLCIIDVIIVLMILIFLFSFYGINLQYKYSIIRWSKTIEEEEEDRSREANSIFVDSQSGSYKRVTPHFLLNTPN